MHYPLHHIYLKVFLPYISIMLVNCARLQLLPISRLLMTASDMAHEVALSRVSQHLRQTRSLYYISGSNLRSLGP